MAIATRQNLVLSARAQHGIAIKNDVSPVPRHAFGATEDLEAALAIAACCLVVMKGYMLIVVEYR
ncbi:hypothetical protein WL28_20885 [Burkholderia ubonensis]|nr:hypothetical protein WJ29_01075 [Burkholderia ubonensis]KVW27422.1 hypothetical protein WK94_01710 [Burkholderia ubonensis]KWA68062.1 hypothetical protein WL28_20885 [Burkholderia ubonensis]OJA62625.1 hypothetical protein BGV70_26510 [Burkholderia ubonensis]